MPASSSRSTEIAAFIFFSASCSEDSTVIAASPRSFRGSVHERPDGLPDQDPAEVPLLAEVEHEDRKAVVPTQRDRGRVHHLEPARENLRVLDGFELVGLGMAQG